MRKGWTKSKTYMGEREEVNSSVMADLDNVVGRWFGKTIISIMSSNQ